MYRADIVTLIAENPNAHGVLDTYTETTRAVFCEIRSIGQAEVYQAKAVGLAPELKVVLSQSFEYQGEKKCSFHGVLYKIIRTYVTDADSIELTLERMEGNANV